MLFAAATAVRTFLLPHWHRWHEGWGPPAPALPSQWTCVRSSSFLARVLNSWGISATLQSGQPPETASGQPVEACGIFTAEGWMGHAWVEANGHIVDITADQFGYAPVIVIPTGDAKYRPARDAAHQLLPTPAGMAAIDAIWPLWCSTTDRPVPLAGCG